MSYQALDLRFDVAASSAPVASYLHERLTLCRAEGPSFGTYDVESAPDGTARLMWDGQWLSEHPDITGAVQALWTDLNRRAIDASRRLLLFHAGACTSGARAVVVAGASGAGKSTLTAALAQSGLQYLTDETVGIDQSNTIVPWRKPVTLKRGSWSLLGMLAPAPHSVADMLSTVEWQVPASSLGQAAGAPSPAVPRLLLFPDRTAGAAAQLLPVSRVAAALRLADEMSYGADHGPRLVPRLANMLRGCDAYRFVYSDLPSAVRTVLRALG